MVYMIDIYANYTNIVFLISRINQCPCKPLPRVVRTVCECVCVLWCMGGRVVVCDCVRVWCGRLIEVRWKDYKESPLRVAITAKRRRQSDAPGYLPGAEECLEKRRNRMG